MTEKNRCDYVLRFKTYPGGGAFALFFHPHPREFATQNKKSANARGLARGGGWAQLELTDALRQEILSPFASKPSRPVKEGVSFSKSIIFAVDVDGILGAGPPRFVSVPLKAA